MSFRGFFGSLVKNQLLKCWNVRHNFQPESPAELGGKIYEMMAIALGGRWGRSDMEEAEASTGEASAEADSSEVTVAEVIEPSEVRPESDPWRDQWVLPRASLTPYLAVPGIKTKPWARTYCRGNFFVGLDFAGHQNLIEEVVALEKNNKAWRLMIT